MPDQSRCPKFSLDIPNIGSRIQVTNKVSNLSMTARNQTDHTSQDTIVSLKALQSKRASVTHSNHNFTIVSGPTNHEPLC